VTGGGCCCPSPLGQLVCQCPVGEFCKASTAGRCSSSRLCSSSCFFCSSSLFRLRATSRASLSSYTTETILVVTSSSSNSLSISSWAPLMLSHKRGGNTAACCSGLSFFNSGRRSSGWRGPLPRYYLAACSCAGQVFVCVCAGYARNLKRSLAHYVPVPNSSLDTL
jgi:hypothetical protein